MRILIVEDEIRLAEVLGEIMKENKYVVDIVNLDNLKCDREYNLFNIDKFL